MILYLKSFVAGIAGSETFKLKHLDVKFLGNVEKSDEACRGCINSINLMASELYF